MQGKQIYNEACAVCHGDQGQGGTDGYADPLTGDLSVAELAQIIAETMPEDDPDSCVAEAAEAVAAYIHHAFYSPIAQAKRNPPQIRLARLTGEQLRQSVADLYAHFNNPLWTTDRRGISGTYFTGAGWGDDRLRIQRIDDVVDFDFGRGGPGEEIDPEVFYIHWHGSLLVPRSGRYEIIVRSSCSFQMQFGRLGPLFFDNHVQSAGKEEFRRTVQLTGGRVYPIKIELQQRKRKTEQPAVRISLSWVPPGGSEQVIPKRHLIPDSYPASFPLQAKLPPDDRSYGYERGIAVDRSWDESTTAAGIEFSDQVITDLFPAYCKRHGGADENRTRLREFLTEFVETALRGPIDDQTQANYIDKALQESGDDDQEAIRRVVLRCFKSPRFLYPTLDADRSKSQRAANRLALVMFDSLPAEAWLIEAAAANKLRSKSRIELAARRMVDDYRCRAKLRSFLYHWLDLEQLGELSKDQQVYPGFDPQLVSDLKQSLDAFLDQVVHSESSDFRQLLQADWSMTNDRIAQFYGDAWQPAQPTADATIELCKSVSNANLHVGVLTHPLLMSHFAYYQTTSPIHRGVFLSRYILGRVIRPPEASFTPLDASLHPDLTTRQRVELQTGEKNCQVCHQKINALGFALEHFDAVGRYRNTEGQRAIDATGSYQPREGAMVQFDSARALGDYLARSEDCQTAFVEAMFEHFVKQPIAAYGTKTSQDLIESFRASGYHIKELIIRIASIAAQPATVQPATAQPNRAKSR